MKTRIRQVLTVRSPVLGLCALLALLASLPATPQTVRPVVVEHKGKARARFELANDSLFPLNVVLEPMSFTLSETGQAEFRRLDPHIHLKLSSMSLRIPPQQSRYVFYEAKADRLPAWFTIYCTFAGLPNESGINVHLDLPHTVYLLQKQRLEESDVIVPVARFDPEGSRVVVEVENTSSRLGRALTTELLAEGKKKRSGGFPLFPESRRRLEIPWDTVKDPEKIVLRFRGFTIEKELPARQE